MQLTMQTASSHCIRPRRGEIWWVSIPDDRHTTPRPAVVLDDEHGVFAVVPCSQTRRDRSFCIVLTAIESVAQCDRACRLSLSRLKRPMVQNNATIEVSEEQWERIVEIARRFLPGLAAPDYL